MKTLRPILVCALGAAAGVAGCVDRRIHITSEPTGAVVMLNDAEVGVTPCEVNFTYFGVYDVRLHKSGFEPLVTRAEAKAPFHEWPGVDLAAMAVPGTKKTRIDWHFTMQPEVVDDAALLARAHDLRGRLDAPSTGAANPEGAPPAAPE